MCSPKFEARQQSSPRELHWSSGIPSQSLSRTLGGQSSCSVPGLKLVSSRHLVSSIPWSSGVPSQSLTLGGQSLCAVPGLKLVSSHHLVSSIGHRLQRAVRCVSPLSAICKHFDAIARVPVPTIAHSDVQDTAKVVAIVLSQNLVKQAGGRFHRSFRTSESTPLTSGRRRILSCGSKSRRESLKSTKGGLGRWRMKY